MLGTRGPVMAAPMGPRRAAGAGTLRGTGRRGGGRRGGLVEGGARPGAEFWKAGNLGGRRPRSRAPDGRSRAHRGRLARADAVRAGPEDNHP